MNEWFKILQIQPKNKQLLVQQYQTHRKRDELTYIHCKYFNLHRSTFISYVDVHFTFSSDLPSMPVLIVVWISVSIQ